MDSHEIQSRLFYMPNSHSVAVIKTIDKLYPAFAKKIFERNPIMQMLVMSGFSTTDILSYPICGHCETLAAYDDVAFKNGKYVSRCTCFRCGKSTIDPILFKDWCEIELKKRTDENVESMLSFIVDTFAERMITDVKKKLELAKEKESKTITKK